MAIILLIKTEDGGVSELPILDKITIGRSSRSDYQITDPKISSSHCTLKIVKGQLIFTDLASTNGSFLNNSVIHETVVRVNDIIRIGNTTLEIDAKRLTVQERTFIGTSNLKENNKTLPQSSGVVKKEKKTIMIKKNLKIGKNSGSNWSDDKHVLEEEKSGHTKFLKLDDKKKKKT